MTGALRTRSPSAAEVSALKMKSVTGYLSPGDGDFVLSDAMVSSL
jgi:hypothetical protein